MVDIYIYISLTRRGGANPPLWDSVKQRIKSPATSIVWYWGQLEEGRSYKISNLNIGGLYTKVYVSISVIPIWYSPHRHLRITPINIDLLVIPTNNNDYELFVAPILFHACFARKCRICRLYNIIDNKLAETNVAPVLEYKFTILIAYKINISTVVTVKVCVPVANKQSDVT